MHKRMIAGLMVLGLSACDQAGFGPGGEFLSPGGGNGTVIEDPTRDPGTVQFFRSAVGDRVLFEVDQYNLTDAAKAALDAQSAWLAENPGYGITIEGHADEQGTREYNLALGARRANAVQTYLLSRGISGERVRTLSYGKERPIEICSNESCYAKNRRAVTVLTGAAG